MANLGGWELWQLSFSRSSDPGRRSGSLARSKHKDQVSKPTGVPHSGSRFLPKTLKEQIS
jgi:hypothetical protein